MKATKEEFVEKLSELLMIQALRKEFPEAEIEVDIYSWDTKKFNVSADFTTKGFKWNYNEFFNLKDPLGETISTIRKEVAEHEKILNSFDEDKVRAFLKDYMFIVRKHKMMFRTGCDEILLSDLETGTRILSDIRTDEVSVTGLVCPNEIYTESEIEVKIDEI